MALIRIAAPLAAVVLFAGCSSEGASSDPVSSLPPATAATVGSTPEPATTAPSSPAAPTSGPRACVDIYVEGGPVTPEVIAGECVAEDSSVLIMGSAVYDCVDGSTIGWNDRAWWDDTVHLYPPDVESQTAPADVLAACTG